VAGLGVLHFSDDIHPFHNLAKDDMLSIKVRRGSRGDEELAAIRIWSAILS